MRLPNPLDKFVSHSIHYIMLAGASTTDLLPFNENVTEVAGSSLDAIDKANFLGDTVSYQGSNVFLMLDTRRFSQFTVEGLKTSLRPTGITADKNLSPNSVTSEFSFTVIDPMGVLFSNFLQHLMERKLEVSFEGMSCLFRIVFVGHLVDGTSETVSSVSIPCMFSKIQLDLQDVKGIYNCEMIPLIGANTTATNLKWTNIGVASKFFTGQNTNTLGKLVESFEGALNEQSKKIYENINKNAQDGDKIGRKVEYMITIPDSWQNFQMTGPNQGRIEETDFVKLLKTKEQPKEAEKKDGSEAPAKESNLAVEPSMSIMQTLDVIFSQCVELAKLGNFAKTKEEADKLTFYRHMVNVTSDNETFMVHVDVAEHIAPNTVKAQTSGGDPEIFYTSVENGVSKTVPKNAVEYDYTFSGTNTDVLELVLNFENLNYMLMSPTKIGQKEVNKKATSSGQNQQDEKGNEDTSNKLANGIRKNDPVLLSDRTWADDKNFNNIAKNVKSGDTDPREVHQQYIKNLAAYYSNGQAPEASAVFRGNPYLLTSTSVTALLPHVKFSPAAKAEHRKNFEAKQTNIVGLENMSRTDTNSGQFTGKNLISGPLFFKINIYGPNFDVENKGLLTHEVDPAVDYTRLYFDNNYYFVSMIESEISGGSIFKHTVHLNPFGIFGIKRSDDEKK